MDTSEISSTIDIPIDRISEITCIGISWDPARRCEVEGSREEGDRFETGEVRSRGEETDGFLYDSCCREGFDRSASRSESTIHVRKYFSCAGTRGNMYE